MKNLTKTQVKASMNEILCVRYSDPELEKSLCLDLLCWGEAHDDLYVQAFAHTYLGDCNVSSNNGAQQLSHLMKARDISVEQSYNELLVRIYSLLGFYYDSIADEQSSLEYYIEAIIICQEVGDVISEGLIYNNIGYILQCHRGYSQALEYYRKAYELIKSNSQSSPLLGILLNNLATVSTLLHQLDEAKEYILACEKECYGTAQYDIFRSQNWCQYYVAMNNPKNAIYWAKHIFLHEAEINENKHYAFDIYTLLFDSMISLSNKEYAVNYLPYRMNTRIHMVLHLQTYIFLMHSPLWDNMRKLAFI